MLENGVENGVEIGVKSLKIRAPGVVWSSWATLLAPRWPKMRFWTRLGLYLEVCWGASWRQDGPSCGQDGAKLPNLAPRWAQDGHLRLQNGQLETILGGILPTFKDIGCEKPDSRKPFKTCGFQRFLGVLGVLLEAMLAHLGAMLGYVGPAGRHLGATWRQDEAQERQDEPRWRTGAPRRGKIAELRRRELSQGGWEPRE